jgi:adenylosuccinate lyase
MDAIIFVVTRYLGYVGLTYVQSVRRSTGSWTNGRWTLGQVFDYGRTYQVRTTSTVCVLPDNQNAIQQNLKNKNRLPAMEYVGPVPLVDM